jgi:hypothetical protein
MLGKLAGVPAITGLIDLSEAWGQIQTAGSITEHVRSAVRNRVVLPIVEKVDTFFQDV